MPFARSCTHSGQDLTKPQEDLVGPKARWAQLHQRAELAGQQQRECRRGACYSLEVVPASLPPSKASTQVPCGQA